MLAVQRNYRFSQSVCRTKDRKEVCRKIYCFIESYARCVQLGNEQAAMLRLFADSMHPRYKAVNDCLLLLG